MFTIKKKANHPNMIWNATDNCILVKFIKGIFKTEDKKLAERLQSLGYEVESDSNMVNIEDMTLEELKTYAKEHNIDLGKATKKGAILKIIQSKAV